MDILKLTNTVAGENTYFLTNEQAVLVIDPGSDSDKIVKTLSRLGKPVAAILLTHAHYDHIMSVDVVRDQFGNPPVYVSEHEASWLYTPRHNLSGLPRHDDMADVIIRPADHTFVNNHPYDLSGFQFKVQPTPGHSIGGVSFVFDQDKVVITGDALFKDAIGRTDLPTGSFKELIANIKTQLFTLPDHYTVYPGHGMNTTIGQEKAFNPFFN